MCHNGQEKTEIKFMTRSLRPLITQLLVDIKAVHKSMKFHFKFTVTQGGIRNNISSKVENLYAHFQL